MRAKSIQRSFLGITLASMLLLALVLGVVSVYALVSKANVDASHAMNLTCANEAQVIDELLEGVEDAVGVECDYVQGKLEGAGPSAEASEWMGEVSSLFGSIAEHADGVIVSYLRVENPDGSYSGFFYLRDSAEQPFRMVSLEDLGGKVPGETEAAGNGWDAEALHAGKALWVEPLEIEGLGLFMASFVKPLMVDGRYAGVVGMGVDFQSIVKQVEAIQSYKTGYGFLADADGYVMYHPAIPYGTNLSDDGEDVPAVDAALAAGTTTGDNVVVYRYNGADKLMAFHVLQNGMRLVLSVNASEIYADRDRLVAAHILITALASIAAVIVSMASSRRTLKPLRELTRAAERVASGDLNVSLPRSELRELDSLVDAYDKTVDVLKRQIAVVDELAHRDALTGFLNKGSFAEVAQGIDARIAAGEDVRFALAMLDVNGLKPVNDTQGHEAGDALLKSAAKAMAETFGDAPLYRIGGDEFAVLMEGQVTHVDVVQGDGVSIACGVAEYRPGQDRDVASVLARADALMYEHKRSLR